MSTSEEQADPRTYVRATVSDHGQAVVAGRDIHIVHADEGRTVRRLSDGTTVAQCPYPGLEAFTAEQAQWFYGRDSATARVVARMSSRLRDGGPLVVVGPSGAGKSSLLRAGVLPAISRNGLPVAGSAQWPQIVCTPTEQPMAELTRQIETLTGVRIDDPDRLVDVLRDWLAARGDDVRVVIVVDQLEELFFLCPEHEQRQAFLDVLDRIACSSLGLVVYGLRMDAYSSCAEYPQLRAVVQDGQIVLGPMSRDELRWAILNPAHDVGLTVESGLVDLLLRDLCTEAGPGREAAGYEVGRLPLLAHALQATWQQRHGHLLTVEGYRVTGGIHDAVASSAEQVFGRLTEAEQRVTRGVFLRLVRIGDAADNARRTVSRDVLLGDGTDREANAKVVDAFTRGRLLSQDMATVTITHEILLRAWPRLRAWIDEDRAGNLTRQKLEESAAVWQEGERDAALLLRGHPLETAQDWVRIDGHDGDLSPVAGQFYATSLRHHVRTRRRRRGLIALLSVLTLTATATAVYAFQQRTSAQRELEKVSADTLLTTAQVLEQKDDPHDQWLAGQLDLAALQLRHESDQLPNLATTDPALYTALVTDASTLVPLRMNGLNTARTSIWALSFAPAGHALAIGIEDDTHAAIQIQDVDLPGAARLIAATPLLPESYDDLQFSPDGRSFVTISGPASRLRLWIVRGTNLVVQQPFPLSDLDCPYTCGINNVDFVAPQEIAIESDGPSDNEDVELVSFGVDSVVKRVVLAAPDAHHGGYLTLAGADPLGGLFVTEEDHYVPYLDGDSQSSPIQDELWDINGFTSRSRPVMTIKAIPDLSFAFGSRRQQIATFPASVNGGVQIWKLRGSLSPGKAALIPTADGPDTTFRDPITYDSDGNVLAFGDGSSELRIIDTTDPDHPKSIGRPFAVPQTYAISPDGSLIAASDVHDHSVIRLLDLNLPTDVQRLCGERPVGKAEWDKTVPGVAPVSSCAR